MFTRRHLTSKKKNYRVFKMIQTKTDYTGQMNVIISRLTSHFVPDELTAFDLADGREEGPNFLLGHCLRKVIHN